MRNLKWFEGKYLTDSGWTEKYGNYELVSIDSGRTWYNTKTEGKKILITGLTDPKLIKEKNAFRALGNHKGLIDFDDPKDVKLLTDAGFTVEQK